MAMQFIQEPDAPEGMGRVVDPDTGLDRVVYDPELARQLGGTAGAYQTEAPRDLAPAEHLRAAPEGPPAPAPAVAPEAERWEAAQAAAPVPAMRYSGAPRPPPAAPDGTVLSKAKIEMGTPATVYDKAAEEDRAAALLERTAEIDRRAAEVDVIKNEQQIELTKQKNESAKREAEESARAKRFESELDSVVSKEINQDRLQENAGFFGSILGLVGKTLGYLATPESGFGRLQADLDRRVQRDIEAQKEQKNSMIGHLTKKLGSAQQAENHFRAQVNSMTANIIENRLQRLGLQHQYADQIQALRDQALAYNEAAKAASYGKPGEATYEFERPKPTGQGGTMPAGANPLINPTDAEDQALLNDALASAMPGMNPNQRHEAWRKFTDSFDTNDRASAAATTAKKALQQYQKTNDVAGFGPLAKYIPTDFAGKDAVAQRQMIGNAVFSFIKAQSGAAFTEQEYARRLEIALGKGDFDSMDRGLDMMLQDSTIANQNMKASAPALYSARNALQQRQSKRSNSASDAKREQEEMAAKKPEEPKPKAEGTDPIKTVRRKGINRAIVDFFNSDGIAPGSPL